MRSRDIFATNLRRVRTSKGLSQEALAHVAGINRTYVSALERSKYSATLDMIDDLAEALGVEPLELIAPAEEHGPGPDDD